MARMKSSLIMSTCARGSSSLTVWPIMFVSRRELEISKSGIYKKHQPIFCAYHLNYCKDFAAWTSISLTIVGWFLYISNAKQILEWLSSSKLESQKYKPTWVTGLSRFWSFYPTNSINLGASNLLFHATYNIIHPHIQVIPNPQISWPIPNQKALLAMFWAYQICMATPPGLPLKNTCQINDSIAVEDNSMMRRSDSVFWDILGDKNITHSPLVWEYDGAQGSGIKPGALNPT